MGFLLLGGLWGLWHLPVIDFLGSASPHGVYWLPFVQAFMAVIWAVRVLISLLVMRELQKPLHDVRAWAP